MTAPVRLGRLLVIALAVALVATGAGMYLRLPSVTTGRPSSAPAIAPGPPASVAPYQSPAPSPSETGAVRAGALIAFTRNVAKPNKSVEDPNQSLCYSEAPTCQVPRLWIVGADGSAAHEVFPAGRGSQSGVAWSPDGTRLLYSESGKLYLTDASGSEPQLVDTGCAAPCNLDGSPSFSRDGTQLVFARNRTDGSNVIATMDLATGRVAELISTAPAGGMLPGWSPDGKQIVFWRLGEKDTGGPVAPTLSAVFVVDADGQNLRQISPATLAAQSAGWSPDGSQIAFTALDWQVPGAVGVLHQDIYTIRPDGTGLHRLTTDGTSGLATWMPDGRILFTRGAGFFPDGGSLSFWTTGADGTGAAQLIPGMLPGDQDPTWTPAPAWQPIGGPAIVPPPWIPAPATLVGPPPPTPPATPTPALSGGFSWTGSMKAASPPAEPLGDTATLLADGRVLVTTGCTTEAELYDPATGAFRPTGSLAATRGGETATRLRDGRVLVAGGYNCPKDAANAGIWASAELYDPATGTFSPTGSMATPREFHTATLLADGRVLIAGGITMQSPAGSLPIVLAETSSNVLASAELYDPATGTFSRTGTMHDFRNDHTATLLPDGRVLVVGGGGEGYASRASAELYDPRTGTFSRTGSMASGRWLHTATLLRDGRVLVIGGKAPDDKTYATAEVYDPDTGSFTSTGSLHASRQQQTATLLANGRVLVAGGYAYDGARWDVLSSAELYDPRTGTFTAIGSMGQPRMAQAATLLNDGRVLIAGGFGIGNSGSVGLTSAVLHQP